MNVIFVDKQHLPVYTEKELIRLDLSIFFSTHKHSSIFVTDDYGNLLGYISHSMYKLAKNVTRVKPNKFEHVIEKDELASIDINSILSEATSYDVIPLMKDKYFIGALVKNYTEELVAFDRIMNYAALNVLDLFKTNVIEYFRENNIESISILAESEDFNMLKSILDKYITLKPYGDSSGQIIIDMGYSKSYRNDTSEYGTPVLSLEDLLTIVLIPVIKDYCECKGINVHIYEGPIKDKLDNSDLHCLVNQECNTFGDAVSSKSICESFSNGDNNVYDYLTTPMSGPFNDNYVITNGINLLMAVPNRGKEIHEGNALYFYGPCLTFGACVPECLSIPTIVRQLIKNRGYNVINCGVKNGHSLLNDFLYILNTRFEYNDHIIIINAFTKQIRESLEEAFNIIELSKVLNQNEDLPWYFLDNTFHVNHVANQIIASAIVDSINLSSIDANPLSKPRKSFFDMHDSLIKYNSRFLLERGLLGSYKEYLLSHKINLESNAKVGAVLLTANPITLGHEYLIKYAKRQCDILYVFVVEEDMFLFSTAERMLLIHDVINDPNIIVISTGNLMTAKFTFPEYFSKGQQDYRITHKDIPDIHCDIFGGFVCPLLGITKRFVGDEESDSVTAAYNEKLITILPKYRVEVVKIHRLETSDNIAISSSTVRRIIESKSFSLLSSLVSDPVKEYIEAKWKVKE